MKKSILLILPINFCVTFLFCQTSDSIKSEALFSEGVMLHNYEKYDDAISKFENALKITPNMADAYFHIGLSYQRLNLRKESIENYTKAIELDSSHRKAYGYRAYEYFDAEEYKAALADFNQVIRLDSVNFCLYLSRGVVKYELGNYSGAIEDYEYLLERKSALTPSELTSAYFFKAESEYYRGNSDQAFFDFDTVVVRDSLNSEAFLYLASISADQDYFSEAMAYVDRCLQIDSDNAEAFFIRGYCKYHLNIDDLGKSDWQKSADLGNDDAEKMLRKAF